MKKTLPGLLIFICTLFSGIAVFGYEHGLRMVTLPASLPEFSGLVLNEARPVPFSGRPLTLSFEVYNRPECLFGTVARAVTDAGAVLNLNYGVADRDAQNVELVFGSEDVRVLDHIPPGGWTRVSMTFDPKEGILTVRYGDGRADVRVASLSGARNLRFSFGSYPQEPFQSNDVASVDIRNVRIWRGERLVLSWPLGEHDGDVCLDSLRGRRALARNPQWLMDRYAIWRPCFEASASQWISYAFDGEHRFYYAAGSGDLTEVDLETGTQTSLPFSGQLRANAPDLLAWTGGDTPLLFYNLDDDVYRFFDPEKQAWSGEDRDPSLHDYFNKTTCWSADRGLLYSFGGYGHHRYNHTLTVVDPHNPSGREDFVIEEITPRYCSSSCLVGNRLYVFGGRGSQSGRQDMAPATRYDLYSIDLDTRAVRKWWECDASSFGLKDFLPGGNMVYDRERDCFYVLTNIQGFSLLQIDREEPRLAVLSQVLDRVSAQYLYKSLFLDKAEETLYAVVEYSQEGGASAMLVSALAYPPCPAAGLSGNPEAEKGSVPVWILVVAGMVLALGALAVYGAVCRKKKSGPEEERQAEPVREPRYYLQQASAIQFLGGFRVTDRDGEDITAQFSPTLRGLLILMILLSDKYPGGIPGNVINSLIWSYKEESSANNTRNVFMYKLRVLVERVGDMNIVAQNKLWKLEIGEGVFCDYLEVKRLFSSAQDEESIDRLLELLMRGMMLPGVEVDWVDSYKSEFSNVVIDFLEGHLKDRSLSDALRISIADAVFRYDYLNEEAIRTKCSLLYAQGKAGLAKRCYDAFSRQYKMDLDIDCPIPFKQMIEPL